MKHERAQRCKESPKGEMEVRKKRQRGRERENSTGSGMELRRDQRLKFKRSYWEEEE